MARRILAVALAVALTSCSYMFVHSPPADDPTDPGDCTESRVPPVLDTALASLLAVTLLVVIPQCLDTTGVNQDGTPKEGCETGQWIGLGWTGVVTAASAISAVHGFRATSRCRDRRALEQPVATSARS